LRKPGVQKGRRVASNCDPVETIPIKTKEPEETQNRFHQPSEIYLEGTTSSRRKTSTVGELQTVTVHPEFLERM